MTGGRRWVAVACLLFGVWLGPVTAGEKGPAVGVPLPQLVLNRPKDTAHQAYLGVAANETFAVSQIEAEVLILEVFNMY